MFFVHNNLKYQNKIQVINWCVTSFHALLRHTTLEYTSSQTPDCSHLFDPYTPNATICTVLWRILFNTKKQLGLPNYRLSYNY